MNTERVLRAIANPRRLRILDWLRSPTKHFPPQVDGDLIRKTVLRDTGPPQGLPFDGHRIVTKRFAAHDER